MFKNLTGFANLLKNAGQLTEKAAQMKARLESERIVGTALDGGIKVTINGVGEVQSVDISDEILSMDRKQDLRDGIAVATNMAVKSAKQIHADGIREMTGDLEIPGMENMLQQFTS